MTKPITHHQSPILIIGFGNLFRSDDAVGIHIAQKLKEQKLPNVTVVEESCEPVSLIDEWKHRDLVIIVDAVSSGATAGTVHKLDASSQKIPAKYFRHSTHAVSIAEAIELARTLGTLHRS